MREQVTVAKLAFFVCVYVCIYHSINCTLEQMLSSHLSILSSEHDSTLLQAPVVCTLR